MGNKQTSKGIRQGKAHTWPLQRAWMGCLMFVSASAATADHAVYRCGDAYSASAQCQDGPATELIQPSAELHTHTPDPASVIKQAGREAQALETNRRQTAYQVTPTVPPKLGVPQQSNHFVTPHSTEHSRTHGKHKRKGHPQSPYFTAKDPSASAKKKSNAKALPAKP